MSQCATAAARSLWEGRRGLHIVCDPCAVAVSEVSVELVGTKATVGRLFQAGTLLGDPNSCVAVLGGVVMRRVTASATFQYLTAKPHHLPMFNTSTCGLGQCKELHEGLN